MEQLTRVSERESIEAAFSAGATDYINKPLDRIDLKARMGMVERLVEERRRANAVSVATHAAESQEPAPFETPRIINGISGLVEYLALENYVLTLGRKQMFSIAALGFSVENAAAIYRRAPGLQFEYMLGDVATAISQIMKADNLMFAHAGGGDFICLLPRMNAIDTEQIEDELRLTLSHFPGLDAADGIPMPSVRVGQPVRSNVLSLTRADQFLRRALTEAHPKDSTPGPG